MPYNLVAHAVEDAAGELRVLLLSKELDAAAGAATVAVTVQLRRGARPPRARVARLVAGGSDAAAATSEVSWAGQSFDGSRDGRPSGTRREEVVDGKLSADGTSAVFEVVVPRLSAALLFVER
jgi:hypothetical protein